MSDLNLSRLGSLVDHFNRIIQRTNAIVIVLLASTLLLCVTWQVVTRYVFSAPSTVTDELARFLFMWVGLLAAAQATALRQHLAIDLMQMKLAGRKKQLLRLFIDASILCFAALVMIKGGWLLSEKTFHRHQITPALHIPMGVVYSVVPLSGTMIVFFSVVSVLNVFRYPRGK